MAAAGQFTLLQLSADGFILDWLPDETLYSLVSRYVRLAGAPPPHRISTALFGRPRTGYQHDFPNGLSHFTQLTQGRLGNEDALIDAHSILPFYAALREPEVVQRARAQLKSSSDGGPKFILGIPAGRFRANHPLKACASCMQQDLAHHGTAYWHLDHQIPGIWICPHHREMLFESDIKTNGVQRFSWVLPDLSNLVPCVPRGDNSESLYQAASVLADCCKGLWQFGQSTRFVREALAFSYARALDLGVSARSGERLSTEAVEFLKFIAPLRSIRELRVLPSTEREAVSMFRNLLRGDRGAHPLWHVPFIAWKFEKWTSFLRSYEATEQADAAAPVDGASPMSAGICNDAEGHFRRLVEHEGASLRAASEALGISMHQALALAGDLGLPVARRPKQFTSDKRALATRLLRAGYAKQNVARRVGCSEQTVNRLLRYEPGLGTEWRHACRERADRLHRRRWSAALETAGSAGVTLARARRPESYAWLYKHDRAWLIETNAQARKLQPSGVERVDWDARDLLLASMVCEAAAAAAKNGGRVYLWQLYQAVPELRAKVRSLPRLPLTSEAIARALKWSPPRASQGKLI